MAIEHIKKIKRAKQDLFSASREMVTQIAFFVTGAILSRGASFGELSPFGAALCAASPFRYLFSSIAGSVLGYILLNPSESFRYITIVVAIGAIRWMFNDIKRIAKSAFFVPLVAFLPVAATGVALMFSSTSEISVFSICITEAFAAAGAAYFFIATINLFLSNRTLTSFNQQEIASIVFTGCVFLIALNVFNIGGVYLGRILAGVMVLLCARYGGIGIGSVCGIATGIVFSLNSAEMLFVLGIFAFGGLIAGVFSNFGKIGSALAFAGCGAIMSFLAPSSSVMIASLIEIAAACAIFLSVPKSWGSVLSAIFLNKEDTTKGEAFKNSVVTRLDYASEALKNVSDCVTNVSDKLQNIYTPDDEWIFGTVKDKTCTKCGLRVYCWEKEQETTQQDFNKLWTCLEETGEIELTTVEKNFKKSCCKQKELANAFKYTYDEYLSCRDANRRITQIRSVVAGQFSGLSEILKDMSKEFSEYCKFDIESSEKITNYLSKEGLAVIGCNCMVDNKNRMTIEIEAANNHRGNIKKNEFSFKVGKICGRRFDRPTVDYSGDKIRIFMSEEPLYYTEIGSCQHIANNAKLCGDSYTYFEDGAGNLVCIISDGMGTGGKAAIDGNMASSIMKKLCKAGLSYDCSLQVVNSSLIVKSEDETSATMDVSVINLFNGEVKLMKAGAATTFFKKGKSILKKDLPALPLGILYDVKFSKDEIQLDEGDVIVMVSDGAILNDDKWLEALIKNWEGSMDDLAAAVVEEAQKRRNNERDDDITAIAVKLNK